MTEENIKMLTAEYNLIQDKKSELSARQRMRIVQMYEYAVKIGEIKND